MRASRLSLFLYLALSFTQTSCATPPSSPSVPSFDGFTPHSVRKPPPASFGVGKKQPKRRPTNPRDDAIHPPASFPVPPGSVNLVSDADVTIGDKLNTIFALCDLSPLQSPLIESTDDSESDSKTNPNPTPTYNGNVIINLVPSKPNTSHTYQLQTSPSSPPLTVTPLTLLPSLSTLPSSTAILTIKSPTLTSPLTFLLSSQPPHPYIRSKDTLTLPLTSLPSFSVLHKSILLKKSQVANRELPTVNDKIKGVESQLKSTRRELASLSSSSLQSAGSSLRDLYSKHLTSLLLGSISAPPSQFGLTLSEEKSQLPGAETPILTKELVERIGNAECRLVGGSQYHRAVREMGVVVESCSCGRVSSEEVALASGVGAVHDGPDFLRASCLIAMEKAYGSFEPILDEFRERVEFIMKRGFDAVQYMVDNTPNYNDHPNHIDVTTYKKPFGDLVKRIFVEFVEEKGREAQDYCKDDLRALTKYITWDLEERGNEALAEAIGGGGREAVEVYNLAIEESINGRKSKPTPTINAATQVQKRTKKRKKKTSSSSSNPKPDILKEWEEANSPPSEFPPEDAGEDLTSGDLVGGLMNRGEYSPSPSIPAPSPPQIYTSQPNNPNRETLLINALSEVASRTDVDKTSAVINALVGHLSFKWRSNFARQVATKFNCFFLLSFMDEFNEYLRLELNKVYSNTSSLSSSGNTVGSLFDLREMSTKLEDAERELERELDKLMFKKKMLEDIVSSK